MVGASPPPAARLVTTTPGARLSCGASVSSSGDVLLCASPPLPRGVVSSGPGVVRHGGGMSFDVAPAPASGDPELVEQLEDLVCTLWLYTGHYAWKQLTTEQRELFADVLDRRPQDDGDFEPVDRWWR